MTTIAEDMKSTLDTDWNEGTVTLTSYVFMKTSPDATVLEPPATPAANNVSVIIMEAPGVPIRRTVGADLIVYDGEMYCYAPAYATMILAIAELKQIANDLTTGTGDLSLTIPAIHGEIRRGLYLCVIKYHWEKLTNRG